MANNGKFWTDEELRRLQNDWQCRPADMTGNKFSELWAEEHNRTKTAVWLKLRSSPWYSYIPTSEYQRWNNPPMMEGDAFVLLDAHIPFHHAEFISKCLDLCKHWKIGQMILGGDALDFHAFAEFPPNFEDNERGLIDSKSRESLVKFADTLKPKDRERMLGILADAETESGNVGEEIRESRKILKALEEHFENILWIMGNHEQRVTRLLRRVLDVQSVSRLMGTDSPKWKVSPYYMATLTSAGTPWRIEHPINSGKGSSKKLSSKFLTNIIMGHNHHFSITTDPSGTFYAIEPGMGGDEERMGYVQQRDNAADKHMVGAIIIRDGKPTPLNRFTDWEMLK